MIVPMKKVSLVVLENQKKQALKELRSLGLLHIEISQGNGARLLQLNEQVSLVESAIFILSEKLDKGAEQKSAEVAQVLEMAEKTAELVEEIKSCNVEISALTSEYERIKHWGNIDLEQLSELSKKGVELVLCEMPAKEYDSLGDDITTLVLSKNKTAVCFAVVEYKSLEAVKSYIVELPKMSTDKILVRVDEVKQRLTDIEAQLKGYSCFIDAIKLAAESLQKEIQFEIYSTGMENAVLTEDRCDNQVSVAYFKGYIPAEDVEKLKVKATENSWGLLIQDPTDEDDVPTKLKNNKFVSLIYPLTDFLGTVPGYFEYDISGWFLGFILIFFGIIFGDGGYGLVICAVTGLIMLMQRVKHKRISQAYYLIMLFGGATILWGALTCTWFGLTPEQLPLALQKISVPVISNVYAEKIWYPPWTNGEYGLTTAQNVQILCFSLALVQLTVAHIKGMIKNSKSLKLLGDLGAILQLLGIFYVVLALVVNGQVFGLGLVLCGIPVGTVAIAFVGVGFAMSFIFANYDGSVGKSILESLKNIVSVLLGVVNVFSDIVSYIRLWAVGLAGAAISATVNELAGPLFGNFMFMVLAIVLLVFGHGLNMILNVLSVIVHGVRLNTLEFSTHLDMSWSGHKYKPFEE